MAAIAASTAEAETDPLDAFMASIDSEILNQVATSPSSLTHQPSAAALPATSSGVTSASPAQVAVSEKVSASPYCDVLRRGTSGLRSARGVDQGSGEGGDRGEAREACLRLLIAQPAEFLRRYGHILTPADLRSLLPSQDPEVTLHITRLQTLMSQQQPPKSDDADDVDMAPATASPAPATPSSPHPRPAGARRPRGGRSSCPPDGARARNRRYRRLQQLAEGGVWFSDEAMKERDPWLWFECVGRKVGEERPAPKGAVEEVPGSTSVGTYLQESLGFLSQKPGDWPTGKAPTSASAAAAAAGARTMRTGPSLGMAFLSGLCTAGDVRDGENGEPCGEVDMEMDVAVERRRPTRDSEALDIGPGETVDVSDIPASLQTVSPTGGVSISSDGLSKAESFAVDADDGGGCRETAAVTAAVAAFGIRGGGDGDAKGDDPLRSENAVDGGVRHVRFVDQEGVVLEAGPESDEEDCDAMQEDEGEQDEEEDELGAGGREEVARVLSERFMAGEEAGVDYQNVDGDERLDDLDQLARDEEDRWFRGQGDDGIAEDPV